MSTGDNNYETDLTPEEIALAKSIKTVSVDGEVVSLHDPKSLREEQDAEERKEAFRTGQLQRLTRVNMSGGVV